MDRISALIQYLGSVDDEEHQVARHAQPLPCRNAQHGAAAALARELRQVIHRRTERRSVPRRAEVHQRCAGPGSSAPGTLLCPVLDAAGAGWSLTWWEFDFAG